MFNFSKENNIIAPVSGDIVPLSDVNDGVFSTKLVGDGIAINPNDNLILAPASGRLLFIFNTGHAFGMKLNNGIELLVHIGINTIELDGGGFKILSKEGKKVKVGDPIIRIDRDYIKSRGYDVTTPVLITNMELVEEINYNEKTMVEGGKDIIYSYKLI